MLACFFQRGQGAERVPRALPRGLRSLGCSATSCTRPPTLLEPLLQRASTPFVQEPRPAGLEAIPGLTRAPPPTPLPPCGTQRRAEGGLRPPGSPTCSGGLPQRRAGPGGAAAAPAAAVARRRAASEQGEEEEEEERRRRAARAAVAAAGRAGDASLGSRPEDAARGRSQPCRARGAEPGRAAPWRRRALSRAPDPLRQLRMKRTSAQ